MNYPNGMGQIFLLKMHTRKELIIFLFFFNFIDIVPKKVLFYCSATDEQKHMVLLYAEQFCLDRLRILCEGGNVPASTYARDVLSCLNQVVIMYFLDLKSPEKWQRCYFAGGKQTHLLPQTCVVQYL